jgi:hypothetical protein
MRQRPGFPCTGSTERPDNPGFATPEVLGGKKRDHIWTHYFVGGSTVPISLPENSKIQPKLAVDRLKNAATLEIHTGSKPKKGGLLQFQVDIKNTGAGHYLPTGLTEIRQMWLEVSVSDSNNETLYHSGMVDGEGKIDPEATIYHTVFGDENGEPTLHVWAATHVISDNRVPPKGKKEEKFVCLLSDDMKSPLKIKAILNYRSAPQDVVNALLGEKAIKLPIINMAELSMEVDL